MKTQRTKDERKARSLYISRRLHTDEAMDAAAIRDAWEADIEASHDFDDWDNDPAYIAYYEAKLEAEAEQMRDTWLSEYSTDRYFAKCGFMGGGF